MRAGRAARRWMPTLAAGLSIGEYARSLVRRLAFLAAVLLAAIWALDGQGYFWPAWAWLGLGVLVLLDFAAGWAWRQPAGRGAPGRVRVGAGRRRGGDPAVHVAADVAAGGRARRSGRRGRCSAWPRPAAPTR